MNGKFRPIQKKRRKKDKNPALKQCTHRKQYINREKIFDLSNTYYEVLKFKIQFVFKSSFRRKGSCVDFQRNGSSTASKDCLEQKECSMKISSIIHTIQRNFHTLNTSNKNQKCHVPFNGSCFIWFRYQFRHCNTNTRYCLTGGFFFCCEPYTLYCNIQRSLSSDCEWVWTCQMEIELNRTTPASEVKSITCHRLRALVNNQK